MQLCQWTCEGHSLLLFLVYEKKKGPVLSTGEKAEGRGEKYSALQEVFAESE